VPAQYTPVPTNHAQITLVSGGDLRNAASVDLAFSQLADKVEFTRRGSILAPATIGSDQTDYNPAGLSDATELRIDASSDLSIRSLSSNVAVKLKLLVNASASAVVTLVNQSGAVTVGYQFLSSTGANVVLKPNESVFLWYDSDTALGHWRVISTPTGGNYSWSGQHTFSVSPALSGTAEINYAAPRARVSMMPLVGAIEAGAWGYDNNLRPVSISNAGSIMIPLRLPTGAVLTGVLAGITGVDGLNSISLTAHKNTHNVLDFTSVSTQLGSLDSGGTAGDDTLSVGTLNETIDNATTTYHARFVSTNVALQTVRWLACAWNDVGIRNF
jgi:hypothetical protein